MKHSLFLGLALMGLAPVTANAQENAENNYIRNSVYMLKLDMPAENKEYEHAYDVTNKAFDGIDFAKRYSNYNDFNLGSHHIDWSKVPTATAAEMDAIEKESAKDKTLKTMLQSMGVKVDPIAEREYAARLLKYFNEKKFGNKLVAKWHVPAGADYTNVATWDGTLSEIWKYGSAALSAELREYAKKDNNDVMYNMETQLLNTTYVCVNNYRMMTAQEKSATAIALAKVTLEYLPGLAQLAGKVAVTAAEKAAEKTKGYFVRTNAYLFKLDWDAEKTETFYNNYWGDPENGDPAKIAAFNSSANYQLKYVGRSSKYAGAGLTMKSANLDKLIARGALRATDAAFAALQRDYDEFRPMSSLHVQDGKLVAYIGTKEGVKAGDKFDVFTRELTDKKTYEWKKVGSIKVAKGSVWDNQEGANETLEGAAEDGEQVEGNASLQYTVFSDKPSKKIGEGCLIRLAK